MHITLDLEDLCSEGEIAMENVIYVGEKSLNRYITTALILANRGASNIVLKARGNMIKKAVDLAEILRRQYLDNVAVYTDISTETLSRKDRPDQTINVSVITIKLEL
jgi:DNA-binding protein Alba